MLESSKTNKWLGITIGVLVFLLVCFASVLYDFWANRMTEIMALSSQLNSLKAMRSQSASIRHIVNTTKEAGSKIDMFFITKATVGSFIEELESYALRADVDLKLNSPSVEKDKMFGPDKFLKFSLRVEGEFKNVMHFLKLIEIMPYKTSVTLVKIDKLESEDDKSKLWSGEITFNLISYIDK